MAQRFKISPEAVRRILRSKWVPDPKRAEKQKQKFTEKIEKIKAEKKIKQRIEKELKRLKLKKPELFDETQYLKKNDINVNKGKKRISRRFV